MLVVSAGIFLIVKNLYALPIFMIDKVKSNIAMDENIIREIEGQSLLSLDLDKVYYRIVKEDPQYRSVNILKEFPSSLVIDITKREFFAQIKADKFFPVDKEGVIIGGGSNQPLPGLISIEIDSDSKTLKLGAAVGEPEVSLSLALITALKEKNIIDEWTIESINARSVPALYFIINGTKITVGEGNYERKLYIFKNVLKEKLGGDISSVTYIDLRYKKVYLGYKR